MAKTKTETRQTIKRDPRNPEPHLDSGYEGDDTSDEFSIPPCGIEDVDIALFNLFDKDIGFTTANITSANKKRAIKKPFVIFATGERFALSKRLSAPRDKNKTLMLPAISIRRTSITQAADDITGRGINQNTGILTIKRRLQDGDVDYQNLINKIGLKNANLPETSRTVDSLENTTEIQEGALLTPMLGDNMWEIITIPQPQYFTNTYEVTFWTSYTQHMNYLIETYISSFLPQGRAHKLTTDKGYWFIASAEDNFTSQENFDDFAEDKRVVRYTFNVVVKGFLLATNHETNKVPIRRWISSPLVTFESFPADPISKQHVDRVNASHDKTSFALTDTEQDPATKQTLTTDQRYYSEKKVYNPKTKKHELRTVGILESNHKKGETVFFASSQESFDEYIKSLSTK
jgi:hypothetical protein